MISRLAMIGMLAIPALPVLAANKEMERLQIQVASIQAQVMELQRIAQENQRELRRLNEALAEQNAAMKKTLQDQRVHGRRWVVVQVDDVFHRPATPGATPRAPRSW